MGKTLKRPKTNEDYLKDLIKEICNARGFEAAILRERIQKIADLTRQEIAKNPEPFRNPFMNERMYLSTCDIIDRTLNMKSELEENGTTTE